MLKVTKNPAYTQTKIRFCQTDPYRGLDALGMWYSYCLQSEISKWQSASKTAAIRTATDKAAFCLHPAGYNIRRISTDGKFLKVYDCKGFLKEDTLLPIAILGSNVTILELVDVVPFLKSHGGVYCRFGVGESVYNGYVLKGDGYSAAW